MKMLIVVVLFAASLSAIGQKTDERYFELRTYHCHENKRPDLIKRFKDHTIRLFKKHGITNVGYFVPVDTTNYSLVFILAYPNKGSRDSLWNSFANDPDWQRAKGKSEENGPLVEKVDQVFMTVAPELSPAINGRKRSKRVFELRTYYCFPGKLADLRTRFENHTRALFEKHGMTNIVYWVSDEKDNAQSKLVYLLAHKSEKAGKTSFTSFGNDPEWQRVAKKSEENGKIVEKVVSVYLEPLPFSPLK
jgi:hypothetical protein